MVELYYKQSYSMTTRILGGGRSVVAFYCEVSSIMNSWTEKNLQLLAEVQGFSKESKLLAAGQELSGQARIIQLWWLKR